MNPTSGGCKPVWFYDWAAAPRFSPAEHGALRDALRHALDATG